MKEGVWVWTAFNLDGDCVFVVSLNVISSVGMELALASGMIGYDRAVDNAEMLKGDSKSDSK